MDGPHTLGRWVADRAATHPDKVAVDDRGVRISYAALARRADDLAAALRRAGHGPGDRVVTLTGNSIDHLVVFLACARSGLALVPLSWRLTSRELAEAITVARPALALAEPELIVRLRDACRRAGAPAAVTTLGSTGVEAGVPIRRELPGEPWPVQRDVADDDPLLVVFTSGSESRPKGVVLTHANCFWTNLALDTALPVSAADVVLAVLPQFHVAAWNVQPLLALWRGATLVLEREFDPGRVLQLLEERGVTHVMAVPTHYQVLASHPAFDRTDLSGLRAAVVGGAPMPAEVAATWAGHGVHVRQGYGLTEAAPNVLLEGRPYPYVEVRLVDPSGGRVIEGDGTGELQVRGPVVFPGYLGDAQATARSLDGDWLRTGDLAERADGRFRVVDRIKSIYISGGENVAPAEVEEALLEHPLVAEAVVVAVPDPVWGEVGVAFVVGESGMAVSPAEVREHARGRLAAFKVPREVVVVEELPRTGIGKLARADLARRAAATHQEGVR